MDPSRELARSFVRYMIAVFIGIIVLKFALDFLKTFNAYEEPLGALLIVLLLLLAAERYCHDSKKGA